MKGDDQFELYDLEVHVTGDPATFGCAHKTGLAFKVQGEDIILEESTGYRFSFYSLSAMLPIFSSKQRSLSKHDWMLSDQYIACPDPLCEARFKIVRTTKRVFHKSEITRQTMCSKGDN